MTIDKSVSPPFNQAGATYVLWKEFDTGETNIANGATVQAIDVPAGHPVLGVWIEVLTAEGAAASIDVGDGSDADRYADAATVNATGWSRGTGTEHIYSSDDTIDVSANAALDAAVFRVYALLVNLTLPNL